MTDYSVLYLAIAYVGVQTFTVKDVVRFLTGGKWGIKNDTDFSYTQIVYAIKQMGCIRTHPGHYTCPWLSKIKVIV